MTQRIMSTLTHRILALIVVGLVSAPRVVGAQVDQRALAQRLMLADQNELVATAERIMTIDPSEVNEGLRSALFAALERQALVIDQVRRGQVSDPEEVRLHAVTVLADAVGTLHDPRGIPGLIAALGGAVPAIYGLARFGDVAARPMFDAIAQAGTTEVADDGLVALRFMVEGAGDARLSPASLAAAEDLAAQCLAGGRSVTTLWRAIDLAVALGDPHLVGVVRSFAQDREAVIARGVTNPEWIDRTQRLAADRLAGVPALPTWR